ncbi:hypothetical protein CISG_04752 [Coccidioides immitis RMSCC 3703]|uniref:Uncharacterized protein n=1 Tax=Coccidioides immitis RMSCC 3703 TaxID=454286 RepID=A0A0J8QVJ4_COCIT|nr:hypothetical protein CISG_04752 [Coccidioides immitis RMSCC 3703]
MDPWLAISVMTAPMPQSPKEIAVSLDQGWTSLPRGNLVVRRAQSHVMIRRPRSLYHLPTKKAQVGRGNDKCSSTQETSDRERKWGLIGSPRPFNTVKFTITKA